MQHQFNDITVISLNESAKLPAIQKFDDSFRRDGDLKHRLDSDNAFDLDDVIDSGLILNPNGVLQFFHHMPAYAVSTVIVDDASKEWGPILQFGRRNGSSRLRVACFRWT